MNINNLLSRIRNRRRKEIPSVLPIELIWDTARSKKIGPPRTTIYDFDFIVSANVPDKSSVMAVVFSQPEFGPSSANAVISSLNTPVLKERNQMTTKFSTTTAVFTSSIGFTNFTSNEKVMVLNTIYQPEGSNEVTRTQLASARWGSVKMTKIYGHQGPAQSTSPENSVFYLLNPDLSSTQPLTLTFTKGVWALSVETAVVDKVSQILPLTSAQQYYAANSLTDRELNASSIPAGSLLFAGHGVRGNSGNLPVSARSTGWNISNGNSPGTSTTTDIAFSYANLATSGGGNYNYNIAWASANRGTGFIYRVNGSNSEQVITSVSRIDPEIVDRRFISERIVVTSATPSTTSATYIISALNNPNSNTSLLMVNLQWIADLQVEASAGVRTKVDTITYGGTPLTQFYNAVATTPIFNPDTAVYYLKNPVIDNSAHQLRINWTNHIHARTVELNLIKNVDEFNPLMSASRYSNAVSVSTASVSASNIPKGSLTFAGLSFQGYNGYPVIITTPDWTSETGITGSASTTSDMAYAYGYINSSAGGSYEFGVNWAASDGTAGYLYSILGINASAGGISVFGPPVITNRIQTTNKVSPASARWATTVSGLAPASGNSTNTLMVVNLQWLPDVAIEATSGNRYRVTSMTYGSATLTELYNAVATSAYNAPDTAVFYLKNPEVTTSSKSLVINWDGVTYARTLEVVYADNVNLDNPITSGSRFASDVAQISSTVSGLSPANSHAFAGLSFRGYDGFPVNINSVGWTVNSGITTSASLTTDLAYVMAHKETLTASAEEFITTWATGDRAAGYMYFINGGQIGTIGADSPPILKDKFVFTSKGSGSNSYSTRVSAVAITSSNTSLMVVNVQWYPDQGAEGTGNRYKVNSVTYGSAILNNFYDVVAVSGQASPDTSVFYLKTPVVDGSAHNLNVTWTGNTTGRVVEIAFLDNVDQDVPMISAVHTALAISTSATTLSALAPTNSYAFAGTVFRGYDGFPINVTVSGWNAVVGISTSASLTTDIAYTFANREIINGGSISYTSEWATSDRTASYMYFVKGVTSSIIESSAGTGAGDLFSPIVLERRQYITRENPVSASNSAYMVNIVNDLTPVSSNYSLMLVNIQWLPDITAEQSRYTVQSVTWGSAPLTEFYNAKGNVSANAPDTAVFYLRRPAIDNSAHQLRINWSGGIFARAVELNILDNVNQVSPLVSGMVFTTQANSNTTSVSASEVPVKSLTFAGTSFQGYDGFPATTPVSGWTTNIAITGSASLTTDIATVFGVVDSSAGGNVQFDVNWAASDGRTGYIYSVQGSDVGNPIPIIVSATEIKSVSFNNNEMQLITPQSWGGPETSVNITAWTLYNPQITENQNSRLTVTHTNRVWTCTAWVGVINHAVEGQDLIVDSVSYSSAASVNTLNGWVSAVNNGFVVAAFGQQGATANAGEIIMSSATMRLNAATSGNSLTTDSKVMLATLPISGNRVVSAQAIFPRSDGSSMMLVSLRPAHIGRLDGGSVEPPPLPIDRMPKVLETKVFSGSLPVDEAIVVSAISLVNSATPDTYLAINVQWMPDIAKETPTGVRRTVKSVLWGAQELKPFYNSVGNAGLVSPDTAVFYVNQPDLTDTKTMQITWSGQINSWVAELVVMKNVNVSAPFTSASRFSIENNLNVSVVSAAGIYGNSYAIAGHTFQGYDGAPSTVNSTGWVAVSGTTDVSSLATDMAYVLGRRPVSANITSAVDFSVNWNVSDGRAGYMYLVNGPGVENVENVAPSAPGVPVDPSYVLPAYRVVGFPSIPSTQADRTNPGKAVLRDRFAAPKSGTIKKVAFFSQGARQNGEWKDAHSNGDFGEYKTRMYRGNDDGTFNETVIGSSRYNFKPGFRKNGFQATNRTGVQSGGDYVIEGTGSGGTGGAEVISFQNETWAAKPVSANSAVNDPYPSWFSVGTNRYVGTGYFAVDIYNGASTQPGITVSAGEYLFVDRINWIGGSYPSAGNSAIRANHFSGDNNAHFPRGAVPGAYTGYKTPLDEKNICYGSNATNRDFRKVSTLMFGYDDGDGGLIWYGHPYSYRYGNNGVTDMASLDTSMNSPIIYGPYQIRQIISPRPGTSINSNEIYFHAIRYTGKTGYTTSAPIQVRVRRATRNTTTFGNFYPSDGSWINVYPGQGSLGISNVSTLTLGSSVVGEGARTDLIETGWLNVMGYGVISTSSDLVINDQYHYAVELRVLASSTAYMVHLHANQHTYWTWDRPTGSNAINCPYMLPASGASGDSWNNCQYSTNSGGSWLDYGDRRTAVITACFYPKV